MSDLAAVKGRKVSRDAATHWDNRGISSGLLIPCQGQPGANIYFLYSRLGQFVIKI